VRERGGRIGGYVEGIMWTLAKAARSPGMLSVSEISDVDKLCAEVATRRKAERRTHTDRDQALLLQFDEPGVMDAFLALPSRTVERVLKSGERTVAAALEIQRALALELWLCAPLRLANFVGLRLDTHFHRVRLDGHERVVVRVPSESVKNRQALEHSLNEDTQDLLELYVQKFRPLLAAGPSPWLFPGRRGRAKVAAAFSTQMKCFVSKAVGVDFHPHLMRKIAVKLVLDANPAEIEIARRQLGHTHANTTRKSYTQHQQRAAQQRYLEVLEGRRLVAMRRGITKGNGHA
jgi:integrase